ncbi:hypothetical protein AYI69_g3977 [Smittium culicis]|uniref:Uncharacterized protein n=1 Tax=Smittium culicis TaxID=133412 RepID=A0A1R1YI04_9FUNG|nr:hypothetical protein AYI69_g3977 [Smittium culicis]
MGNKSLWRQDKYHRNSTCNSETINKGLEKGSDKADENRPFKIKKTILIHTKVPVNFNSIITAEAHENKTTRAQEQNIEIRE